MSKNIVERIREDDDENQNNKKMLKEELKVSLF